MPNNDPASTPSLLLNLEQYLPAQINFLANKLSAGASACYRKHFGVGIVEWRLLALLAIENNMTANRMCSIIGIDKAAVSRAIRQMERNRLITTLSDPDDARRVIIQISADGRRLHDQMIRVALKREELLLAHFTAAETRLLLDMLQRLNQQIETVNCYEPLDHN